MDKRLRNSKSCLDSNIAMPSSTSLHTYSSGNLCHLNCCANVLGEEQQDQKDTGEKDVPSGCSHAGQKSRWYCTNTEHVKVLARRDSDLLSHDKDSRTGSTNLRKWHREMDNKALMRTVKVQAASM